MQDGLEEPENFVDVETDRWELALPSAFRHPPLISLLHRKHSVSTHTFPPLTHTLHISTNAPSKATDPVWKQYQSAALAMRSF